MKRKYGWKSDRPGDPAPLFETRRLVQPFPKIFSWRHALPECYDQGPTSSCTGNAVAAAVDFDRRQDKLPFVQPSRKFIYWNGRALEGTTDEDSGARISDVVNSLTRFGYCAERVCPFESLTLAPSPTAFSEAKHLAYTTRHRRKLPQTEHIIKAALMSGRVVIAGMMVYTAMEGPEAAATGLVPLPRAEEEFLGGHCVDITGWDDVKQFWEVRNSWGTAWGDHGYFWAPKRYFLDPKLSSDFTIIY